MFALGVSWVRISFIVFSNFTVFVCYCGRMSMCFSIDRTMFVSSEGISAMWVMRSFFIVGSKNSECRVC